MSDETSASDVNAGMSGELAPAPKKPRKPRASKPAVGDSPAGEAKAPTEEKPVAEDKPSKAEAPVNKSRKAKSAKPAVAQAPAAEGKASSEDKPSAAEKPAAEKISAEKPSADAVPAAEGKLENAAETGAPKRRRGRPKKGQELQEGSASEQSVSEEVPADGASVMAAAESAAQARSSDGAGQNVQENATADAAAEAPSSEQRPTRTSRSRKRRESYEERSSRAEQQQQQQQQSEGKGPKNAKGQQRNNSFQQNGRHKRRGNQFSSPASIKEGFEEMELPELLEKAQELGLEISDFGSKEDLVESMVDAQMKLEGYFDVKGYLDIVSEGYGFLRTSGYLPGEKDIYVGQNTIKRGGLRCGDLVCGQSRPAREGEKYPAIHRIDTVNGRPATETFDRPRFSDLTPVYPDERLVMEHGKDSITARTIDLVAPIGKGQRGLIVSPPKAGKTTILKDIAAAISANNPDVHLMCLLVDERPEEVTDMERSIKGEVVSSTFDMPCENHIAVAELVIERAKRLVELGEDVVILLDSITRLARAYNLGQPASGRILSGGVDSSALYPPKRFLGAARNIENGGSLTILASALIDTGSKMDEVIFEEFKGTGNMELKLDRSLADRRIFPAIDPVTSGTRKEELLMDPQLATLIWGVRRILANVGDTGRCMEMLIKSLRQTNNNEEFLIRMAKKAQSANNGNIEF